MALTGQLVEIIQALAAMQVTVPGSIAYHGDKTPNVFALGTLPNTMPDAKLPARLLRMMRSTDAGAQSFTLVFGNDNSARVPWRIYDVLLWRKLSQGLGLGSHEADLVKYASAYMDKLKTIPAPTTRSRIINAQVIVAEINFPLESDYWYAGVEVALDIEERLVSTNPPAFS
jgi:hypothetical protein